MCRRAAVRRTPERPARTASASERLGPQEADMEKIKLIVRANKRVDGKTLIRSTVALNPPSRISFILASLMRSRSHTAESRGVSSQVAD